MPTGTSNHTQLPVTTNCGPAPAGRLQHGGEGFGKDLHGLGEPVTVHEANHRAKSAPPCQGPVPPFSRGTRRWGPGGQGGQGHLCCR